MKSKFFNLVSVCAACVLLAGCGSSREATKGEAPVRQAPVVVAEVPGGSPGSLAEQGTGVPGLGSATGMAAMLADIRFDYDKYAIRPVDEPTLKTNSEWLKANPNKKVKIEGYCDERGTVEYNLVLGQKRADAAKSYLIKLGVDGKLLETVSYGKEKPLDPGHTEEAWAKNRRARFEPVK